MKLSLGNRSFSFEIGDDDVIANSGQSYEIGNYIGCGGNAVVYECLNGYGEQYAIKIMLHINEKSLVRFSQEIEVLKKIHHPHVVKYIDSGEIDVLNSKRNEKIPFLIMEKAETNLIEYIKYNDRIEYGIYAPQFEGLCEALSEIHKYAIHRDIKPENILIKGETWQISDFGLCTCLGNDRKDITAVNEKIGPKFWLSPEAINHFYFNNDVIDKYSDVYQLCAVFWFALTHRHPTGIISLDDWNDNEPAIGKIILKSLSNNHTNRPQNGEELKILMNSATIGS